MKDKNNFSKKSRERSTPNPIISIGEAIVLIEELKKALGKGPYSRNSIASALGHKQLTGPAARKVAALTHYNLLEREGDAYSLSRLGGDILHPLSDEQKLSSIKKAAKSPRIFAKLIRQFKNQALPRMLDNILVREGISSNAASEATKVFIKTLEDAGLLKNGIVMDDGEDFGNDGEAVESDENKSTRIGSLDFLSTHHSSETKLRASEIYPYNESGKGWSLSIKAKNPLTSEIKKKLIEVTELLENSNKE